MTKRKSVLPRAAKANAPASQSSVEFSDSSDEEAYRRQQWGPSVNPAAGYQHAHGASTSSAAPHTHAGAKLADRFLFTSFHPHPICAYSVEHTVSTHYCWHNSAKQGRRPQGGGTKESVTQNMERGEASAGKKRDERHDTTPRAVSRNGPAYRNVR